jgi:hypothetical protein
MFLQYFKPKGLSAALIAASLLSLLPTQAAVIVSATSVSANAGDTNDALDVFLTNTGPSSISVDGFNFEITVSGTDVTFTSTTTATTVGPYIFGADSLFGPVISTLSPGQTMDGSDIDALGAVTIGSGATVGLGHVFFNVNPAAAPQTAAVTFVPAGTALSDVNGGPVNINTLTPGTITILSSVPEPATFGMLGFVLAGFCVRLRTRKS